MLRPLNLRDITMPEPIAYEHHLLHRCLDRSDDQELAQLATLSATTWEALIHEAIRLGVSPLLYARLRQLGEKFTPPPELLQVLQATYQNNALHNMHLYQALHGLLRVTQQASIPMVLLKGAHLAQTVYQDIAMRTMGDVDILVREADVPRVEAILQEQGYSFQTEKQLGEGRYHVPYVLATDETIGIEVHWHIEPAHSPFRVDVEGIWQRAQATRIMGMEVLVLSPEDLLLHLCMHNAYHHIFGHYSLRALYDIREVVRHFAERMDWEKLARRCQEWGSDHSVYLTLLLACEILHADVPPALLDYLKPASFNQRMIEWAQDRIFAQVDDTSGPWSDRLGHLNSSTHFADRYRILLQTCFPPRAEIAQQYQIAPHTWQVYFYYPVRLVHRLLRYSLTFLRFARAPNGTTSWIRRETGRTELVRWLSSLPSSH